MRELITGRRVVICAGPGGVGKTTIAAAVALSAAREGRRACVVTIDPARRLADALGLDELSNDPRRLAGVGPGELWALMLDTKATFDALVRRYATSATQAETILANGLYRNISTALGGTQEYMAVEKLWELAEDPRFDLVVIDTPPTRNALDFLEAPERLTRFLTNRLFRTLMVPTRASLRALNFAAQMFVRSLTRVVGGDVVADTLAFFAAFEGMEDGFRTRAAEMTAMLRAPETAFVLVAAPRRDAAAEARYLVGRLDAASLPLEALVVNRVTPRWVPAGGVEAMAGLLGAGAGAGAGADGGEAAGALADLVANLAELDEMAAGEERHIEWLVAGAPGVTVVRIPSLDADVHDLAGLAKVGAYLVGRGS